MAATLMDLAAGNLNGMRLQMTAPNAKAINVALSRFGGLISDFEPFFREDLAPAIFDKVASNFKTEGSHSGGGGGRDAGGRFLAAGGLWKPLSPTYAAWKAKHFPGMPIMRRTDRLFRSLTYDGGRVGPEGIARFGKRSAEIGTSVPYGILHQRGTRHMPARPVLVLVSSETAGRLLHRFTVDAMKQAGLGKTA